MLVVGDINYHGHYKNAQHDLSEYPFDLYPVENEPCVNVDTRGRPVYTKHVYINKDGSVSISKSRLLRKMIDQLDSYEFHERAKIFICRIPTNELTDRDYDTFHYEILEVHNNKARYLLYDILEMPIDITIEKMSGEHNFSYNYVFDD